MYKVNKPKPYNFTMTNHNFDKEEYKELKRLANEDRVRFVVLDRSVVAYAKTSEGAGARMIAVAVSWCAPEDTFNKKVGKYQALRKLYDYQYVQLPLADEFDINPFVLEDILTGMFDL